VRLGAAISFKIDLSSGDGGVLHLSSICLVDLLEPMGDTVDDKGGVAFGKLLLLHGLRASVGIFLSVLLVVEIDFLSIGQLVDELPCDLLLAHFIGRV